MKPLDAFVGATLRPALVVFGLATCLPIVLAVNLDLGNRLLFAGQLDPGPASALLLRHWGLMICGVGVLMIVAAARPWLRFETMVFAAVEKIVLVGLVLSNLGQPWDRAYRGSAILDGIISLYCLLYFVSSYGRPHAWTIADGGSGQRPAAGQSAANV
ncbi:MAG TPA: hypothetical protein VFX03_03945 [Thermomicrobiales bacterium]|nr:hypothetical protein [Thermomicrobiales bacterium]